MGLFLIEEKFSNGREKDLVRKCNFGLEKLESIEFELQMIENCLKNCINGKISLDYLVNFKLTKFEKASMEPNEFVASTYFINYFVVVYPNFQAHLRKLESNQDTNKESLIKMREFTNIVLTYANFLRLRVLTSFLDKSSYGHTQIRHGLLEITREIKKDKSIHSKKAKKLFQEESHYEKVIDVIYENYKRVENELFSIKSQ